jgi:FkbM family methyltransferase
MNFQEFKSFVIQMSSAKKRRLQPDRPVLIFGAGGFGKSVLKVLIKNGFKVDGFIDSKPNQKSVNGAPVFQFSNLSSLDLSSQVIMGVYNRETPLNKLRDVLKDSGFENIFMPWDIYDQFSLDLGWRYWLSEQSLLVDSLGQIEIAYSLLDDEISKQCFINILAFRLGENLSYADFTHQDKQYFNELTLPTLNEIDEICYIDGGAYNGDTYLQLSSIRNISKAFLFEPDSSNYSSLVKNLTNSKNKILSLPLAISDKYSILSFSAEGGEGSAISSEGDQHIATVALDELFKNEPIHFIKLDIEGAETHALLGAARIIKNMRPILAMSLYHKPSDIWLLPQLIKNLNNKYKIYIRQHYFNTFESVLYAVPN